MSKPLQKLLAVAVSAALMIAGMVIPAAAETTPNRSITIHNVSDASPLVRFKALDINLGANGGPFHLVGKVKVTGFQRLDANADAAVTLTVKYGNYDSKGAVKTPDKTTVLIKLTADTAGWMDLANADTSHLTLDDVANSDLMLEFATTNVKCDAAIADLVIADKTNAIVYSLANDPHFSGITVFSSQCATDAEMLWEPALTPGKAEVLVSSKTTYDYTPNKVLTLDIPANADNQTKKPQGNAYLILDFGKADAPSTIFPADKGPFTLRGMMKVENVAENTQYTDRRPAGFYVVNDLYRGDTNGWVPLLQKNGKPFTVQANSGWYDRLMVSWGCTGRMSIADLAVLDKDGNVVYSFATDNAMTEKEIAFRTEQPPLLLWAWDDDSLGAYHCSVAAQTTEHVAADYQLKQVTESYTPWVKPTEPTKTTQVTQTTKTTATTQKQTGNVTTATKPVQENQPQTGATLPIAAALIFVGAGAVLFVAAKKK